ncbi:MAG: transcriptional repressor [Chloroflexi bacterium]|nr:transcriptional repressor [Chloroflexota bacterium]
MSDLTGNPLIQGLKTSGARITAQRIAICEWLTGNETHPTASDVYAALRADYPTMSLATVYNTLSALQDLHLISEAGKLPDGSTRYDPSADPHVNLICTACNRIYDLHDVDVDQLFTAAKADGFRIVNTIVSVYGICQDCQSEEEAHAER